MNLSNLTNLLRLFNNKLGHKKISNKILLVNKKSLNNNYSKKLYNWFINKQQNVTIIKLYTKQLKLIKSKHFIININKYTYKILNDIIIKELINCLKCKKFVRNSRDFFFSAIGVTVFNWDQQKIKNDELYSYANEIELIQELQKRTVICKNCNLRLIIDNRQPNVDYCSCANSGTAINNDEDWQPFIEKNDMIIWRKEEPNSSGLYAYKVFGCFPDVSADEFLQVQVDIDYRKVWDPTAKQLEIIDSDPNFKPDKCNRNDVIYWEMIWPRLFSNRDYVYQRRWIVDKEKGVIIIVSRSIDHPNAPNRPDTYRVESYWSYTIIKPCKDFNEPGIEFGLTYFDDAGVNIPSAVSSWVALNGLPDFLCRMRQAAKDYKNYLAGKEPKIEPLNDKLDSEDSKNQDNDLNNDLDSKVNIESNELKKDKNQCINIVENDKTEGQDNEDDDNGNETGVFRYFFLTKLFA